MIGEFLISFDKKKVDEIFADYQHYFTREEKSCLTKKNFIGKSFFEWID